MRASRALYVMTLSVLAACGGASGKKAPWLTAIDRPTHAAKYFPIVKGIHAVDCNSCHGAFDTFKKFDCLGCHTQPKTDPDHQGIPGYNWDSASCLKCHPNGTVQGGVEHDKYFPIAAGSKHETATCSDCHSDPSNRVPATLTCGSCHVQADMATAHASVGGYQWTSPACVACHADSQVNRVAAHQPFLISSGTKHYRASCFVCHPNQRTDKPWGTLFEDNVAVSWDQSRCFACHDQGEMNNHHFGFSGYNPTPPGPANCLSCHPSGGGGG